MADASIQLEKFAKAETYLVNGFYIVMKNEQNKEILHSEQVAVITKYKSKLRQEFCRVYTFQAKWDKALNEISEDIHETVLKHGPLSVKS